MRLWGLMAAAFLLAGCVTVRGGSADAALGRLLQEVIGQVREVALAVEAGEAADFAAAKGALERARLVAVADAISAPPKELEGLAGHAALGVALGFCIEGLDRVELRLAAGTADPAALATGLRLGCVAPLLLLAPN